MAIVSNCSLLAGVSGKVGSFVVKRYGDKVVLSARPEMRNVKPTELQRQKREDFAAGVQYAKAILQDPEKRAVYERKLAKGENVFRCVLKEYLLKGL